MMNLEAKKMAIAALKKKLYKLQLEDAGMGTEKEMSTEAGDLQQAGEIGENNILEDAREEGEVVSATDGEDGEKEISLEIEAEGSGEGMEELYKRMREEFNSMPKSRAANGEKKTMMAGGGRMERMMAGKKSKR